MMKLVIAGIFAITAAWVVLLSWLIYAGADALLNSLLPDQPQHAIHENKPQERADLKTKKK